MRRHIPAGEGVELYVRGELPGALEGTLIVACSRRNKDRTVLRWHDAQADLVRIDIVPGKPGRAQASILPVDPTGREVGARVPPQAGGGLRLGGRPIYHHLTQPNHGLNIEGGILWATNLLFGFPLEVDVWRWKPRRLLQCVELGADAPRVTSTSHFAWSFDRRFAYFHESLLTDESPAKAIGMRMVRMNTQTGDTRTWELLPPARDRSPESANFHSAFYFEEGGKLMSASCGRGRSSRTLVPMRRSRSTR